MPGETPLLLENGDQIIDYNQEEAYLSILKVHEQRASTLAKRDRRLFDFLTNTNML